MGHFSGLIGIFTLLFIAFLLSENKKSINISDLNSGIYFVRIKNGDYYVTKKLIIN